MWRTSGRYIPTFRSRQLPPSRGLSALRGVTGVFVFKIRIEFGWNIQKVVCVTSHCPVVSGRPLCSSLTHRKRPQELQYYCLFFIWHYSPPPPSGQGLLFHEVSRSHSTTHHSRKDSFVRHITCLQKPLPDNTQQTTMSHVPGGIRTHNLSRRAVADRRLIPRGQWDRRQYYCTIALN